MTGPKLTTTRRVTIALVVTSGVMLAAYAVLSFYAGMQSGQLGQVAAGVAVGACWFSGMLALGVTLLSRDPAQGVSGILFGMLLRMSFPLAVGLMLQVNHSPLLKVGVIEMMIGVYLLGLCVETLFAWWILDSTASDHLARTAKA